MQLMEFLRTRIFARLDGHFEAGTQQLEVRGNNQRAWHLRISRLFGVNNCFAFEFGVNNC